eukprot:scaffold25972_cov30-Attheya_sp.AAC.1
MHAGQQRVTTPPELKRQREDDKKKTGISSLAPQIKTRHVPGGPRCSHFERTDAPLVIHPEYFQPPRLSHIVLVGNGVTGVCNVGQGILAVMMSPMLGKTGGNGGVTVPDTPRRPGRIVLHAALEKDLEHIGEVMLGSGVEILKDSEYSGKYGFCHSPACNISSAFGKKDMFIMACQCKAVAYCDKTCQKAHWKERKDL